jgi:Flp pilus assembly protein TadD
MGEKRLRIPARLALITSMAALLSCSAPRVVILDDPLTAREHVDLGLSYELQGRTDLAEKEYKKAAAKERDWAVPYFNLGNVSYTKKDLTGAEGHFRKALSLDGGNPDIMNNLANVLHEQGNNKEAREFVLHALTIREKDAYLDTLRRIDESPGLR